MQSKNLPDCFNGKCQGSEWDYLFVCLFVLLLYFNSSYRVRKGYECLNKIISGFGKLQHEPLLIMVIELKKSERRKLWNRSVFVHVCSCCFRHRVQAYFWFSLALYYALSLPAVLCMIAVQLSVEADIHISLANVLSLLNDLCQTVRINLLEASNTHGSLYFQSLLQENTKYCKTVTLRWHQNLLDTVSQLLALKPSKSKQMP